MRTRESMNLRGQTLEIVNTLWCALALVCTFPVRLVVDFVYEAMAVNTAQLNSHPNNIRPLPEGANQSVQHCWLNSTWSSWCTQKNKRIHCLNQRKRTAIGPVGFWIAWTLSYRSDLGGRWEEVGRNEDVVVASNLAHPKPTDYRVGNN